MSHYLCESGDAMLNKAWVGALDGWCGARNMDWSAAAAAGSGLAVLLPRDGRQAGQCLRLVQDKDEFRVETEAGEPLVSASTFPALFDALDGGVADRPVDRPVLLGWPGRHAATSLVL
jgi:hypothetical protein